MKTTTWWSSYRRLSPWQTIYWLRETSSRLIAKFAYGDLLFVLDLKMIFKDISGSIKRKRQRRSFGLVNRNQNYSSVEILAVENHLTECVLLKSKGIGKIRCWSQLFTCWLLPIFHGTYSTKRKNIGYLCLVIYAIFVCFAIIVLLLSLF